MKQIFKLGPEFGKRKVSDGMGYRYLLPVEDIHKEPIYERDMQVETAIEMFQYDEYTSGAAAIISLMNDMIRDRDEMIERLERRLDNLEARMEE